MPTSRRRASLSNIQPARDQAAGSGVDAHPWEGCSPRAAPQRSALRGLAPRPSLCPVKQAVHHGPAFTQKKPSSERSPRTRAAAQDAALNSDLLVGPGLNWVLTKAPLRDWHPPPAQPLSLDPGSILQGTRGWGNRLPPTATAISHRALGTTPRADCMTCIFYLNSHTSSARGSLSVSTDAESQEAEASAQGHTAKLQAFSLPFVSLNRDPFQGSAPGKWTRMAVGDPCNRRHFPNSHTPVQRCPVKDSAPSRARLSAAGVLSPGIPGAPEVGWR